ncbi:M16 family metallopeptidase [Vibrio rotiferianus]|uniref:M16 family metallopeptidase n=1 Tax=Vibrio rotiferianus TaxID=190895 RepID=UPI00406A77F5
MRNMLLFPVLLLSGCALAPSSTPIKPDSNWHVDQLANGMKFHIYPTQDEEVSVRFKMNIGSFQETVDQKGYAHFIEHMAFNGSQNFSGNDVIKLFEQSGGSFGADINAFTSYQETTYKLDLVNDEMLKEALTWMRDISEGISFDVEQVEKEKGVILGEWRRAMPDDKSLSYNAYEASIKGTLYAEHDPIGTKASIERATAADLMSFYQKWYQPQYAELIVSGDVDVEQLSKLIKEQFSDWKRTSEEKIVKRRDIQVNTESMLLDSSKMESPSLHYSIDRGPIGYQTREQQHQAWEDEVMSQLIQQRIYAVLNDAAQPFQYVYAQTHFNNFSRISSGGISFSPELRSEMQSLFIGTLASLRDHGVNAEELEAVMAGFRSELTNIDSDWSKRKPNSYVDARVFELEQNIVSQSKQDYQSSLSEFVTYFDVKAVNKQLGELLEQQPAFVIGMAQGEKETQFSNALSLIEAAYQKPGVKPLMMSTKTEGFIQPSVEGKIISKQAHQGGFDVFTLSNGIEVWFQQDKKAGDRAHVFFASQGGKAALDSSLYPAYELAGMVGARSGLGDFTGSELDNYLRTNEIGMFPLLGETHHGVEMVAPKLQLANVLNGIYNLATEIKVEPRQLDAVKKEYYQERGAFLNSPLGKWVKAINQNAYQANSRHRLLLTNDAEGVTAEQILAVHDALFAYDRGFKMVIVADLEPQSIAPLLRKYVASIPLKKADVVDYDVQYNTSTQSHVELSDGHEPSSYYVLRVTNRNQQLPTTRTIFVEDLLQRISATRVLNRLREDASLDYNPAVYSVIHDRETVSDWFFEAQVDPKDVSKVDHLFAEIIDELAADITQDELDTAAKQLANDMKDLENSPADRGWVYTRYLIQDYDVDVLLDVEKETESITLDEVLGQAKFSFGKEAQRTTTILNPKS